MNTRTTHFSNDSIHLVNSTESAILEHGDSALQEEMARETTKRKILSEYNFTFPNGPCKSDGYYHLHLHDAHGRTIPRTVKAKTIEELQEKIYQYHRDLLALDLTFGDMFQRAQEDVFRYVKPNSEAYLSKKNSAARRQQHYNRFIQGTRWANMKVRSFTPMDIDELLVYNLHRYDLRSRAFAGLKSIINMTFTYAASHGCIEHNLFRELDMKKYHDLLVPDASVRERGFSDEEMDNILDYLHAKQQQDPRCTTSWALELVVICALRRGEVPPLLLSDIKGGAQPGLYLHQSLLLIKDAKKKRIDYVPVSHTKTHKNRLYPMSDQLQEFLGRYLPVRAQYYPTSPYLFPARRWDNKTHHWDEGGMITDQTIPSYYTRMCSALGIRKDPLCMRGPHAFRRNAITKTLVASGNIDLTAQLFGNSPDAIRRSYLLDMDYDAKLAALNSCQRKEA